MDLTGVKHHKVVEELLEVLCAQTLNSSQSFFTAELAYFLGKMASTMRAKIVTDIFGVLPVNIYVIALASSGFGKGHSVSIVEDNLIAAFKERFVAETFPQISETNLRKLADERALKRGTDPQEEFDKIETIFSRAGAVPFTFDAGTTPAVRQLRDKLLLADIGAINYQVDEIGANLLEATEMLTMFLELYDKGRIKTKLTKNTVDAIRAEEIDGSTPTNMLLFGTPSKLFDGSIRESEFNSLLEQGYARRCIFGFGSQKLRTAYTLSAQEMYEQLTEPKNTSIISKWSQHFYNLADPTMYGWQIELPKDAAILLLDYRMQCERLADSLPEFQETQKAEIAHRYSKALKLAGAYAFIDQTSEISTTQLQQAIFLVENSGKAFSDILLRERPYARIAKYIAACNEDITHADLAEALPFYKTGQAARNEQILLASAWGYKNGIMITKTSTDNIEFFAGKTLESTSLEKLRVSYSDHEAYNYENVEISFEDLITLVTAEDFHWLNHHVTNMHRQEDNVIVGFNCITIDVDGTANIDVVCQLLEDYKFILHTTKSHTDVSHHFRLVMPIKYILEYDTETYREFINNVLKWLPFVSDECTNQRSRKWATHKGLFLENDGALLDPLPFAPRTTKNAHFNNEYEKVQNLDALQRWFASKMAIGNRNKFMLRYALALVDSGYSLIDIQNSVYSFNKSLPSPLPESEIGATIMTTVAKRLSGE